MKNKNLIMGLGFAAFSMSIQAQTTIYSNGFENNEKPAAGTYSSKYALSPKTTWGDWVNPKEVDNWKEQAGNAHSGEYCFEAENGDNGDSFSWDRGFKIANLPIKENTAYRVSFWLNTSGAAKLSSWLSMGIENFDKSICTPNGTNFGVDSKEFNTGGQWERVSFVSYFTKEETLLKVIENQSWVGNSEFPADFGGNGETYKAHFENHFPNEFFFIVNMFSNDITYKIDDIKIEEGVTFNQATINSGTIRLDFGYATNIAKLADENAGTVKFNKDLVKVTLDGKETEISAFEGKSDGYAYIFLEDDAITTNDIKVSFTPDEACPIKYDGEKRPGSDYEADMQILGFENEQVYETNEEFDVMPSDFDAPILLSTFPENNSFDLDANDYKNFSVKFNNPVSVEYAEAIVTYNDNFGERTIDVDFKKITVGEDGQTVNVELPDLAKGEYTLTIYDISNSLDPNVRCEDVVINFEVGSTGTVELAKTIYDSNFASAMVNGVPTGWYTENEGGVHKYELDANGNQIGYGTGTRVFDGFSGDFTRALYWGTRGSNDGYCTYGQLVNDFLQEDGTLSPDAPEGISLYLEPNKYQIKFLMAAWKGEPKFSFSLENLAGDVFARFDDLTAKPNVNGAKTKVSGSVKCQTEFTVETPGYYVLKFTSAPAEWQEFLLADVNLMTMPAKSAYYKGLIYTAIDEAQAVVDNYTDEKYQGAAMEALKAEIKKANETTYKYPSEVEKGCAALKAAAEAVTVRSENLTKFTEALYAIETTILDFDALDESELKLANSAMAIEAKNLYNQYKDVNPSLLEDAPLAEATKRLKECADMATIDNIKKAVNILTWGAQKALMEANKLGVKGDNVTAVENLTDDDAAIIGKLNGEIAYTLVNKLAAGEDINALKDNVYNTAITAIEQEAGIEYNENDNPLQFKGIDLSSFVRNSHLYRVKGNDGLPGWNIATGAEGKNLNIAYSATPSDTDPVVDCQINIYGDACYNMSQVIEGLPAGYYSLCIQTRTPKITKDVVLNEGEDPVSYTYYYNAQNDSTNVWDKYIYAKGDEGSEGVAPYEGAGGLVTTFVENIKVTNGKLEIGATENYTSGKAIKHEDHTAQSFWTGTVYLDYINIYFVAPIEGYNYSDAATGVENVTANAAVENIYSVGGVRQNKLNKGINIVKYTDGSVRRVYIK